MNRALLVRESQYAGLAVRPGRAKFKPANTAAIHRVLGLLKVLAVTTRTSAGYLKLVLDRNQYPVPVPKEFRVGYGIHPLVICAGQLRRRRAIAGCVPECVAVRVNSECRFAPDGLVEVAAVEIDLPLRPGKRLVAFSFICPVEAGHPDVVVEKATGNEKEARPEVVVFAYNAKFVQVLPCKLGFRHGNARCVGKVVPAGFYQRVVVFARAAGKFGNDELIQAEAQLSDHVRRLRGHFLGHFDKIVRPVVDYHGFCPGQYRRVVIRRKRPGLAAYWCSAIRWRGGVCVCCCIRANVPRLYAGYFVAFEAFDCAGTLPRQECFCRVCRLEKFRRRNRRVGEHFSQPDLYAL